MIAYSNIKNFMIITWKSDVIGAILDSACFVIILLVIATNVVIYERLYNQNQ